MVLLWLVHMLNTAVCSAASTVTSTPPRRSNSRGPRALNYCDVPAAGMALLFALSQVFAVVAPTPSPEDAASSGASSTFHIANDDRGDTYTSAYINVTREFEGTWIWDRSKVGRYGGGYIGAAFGAIVHVTAADNPDDHSGCQLPLRSSRSDRRLPEPGAEPWIALIKRGKCNFEVKVENAFRSSAAGVLVYNDRDSSNLDKMKLSSENGRNISAIFTYKWKGEELARLVENDGRVLVHITIAEHTSSRSGSINRTSVLFVSITFIVLMIISLAWLVFYYVQRFRYIHAKDRLSRRLCNAAKKALSKIPTKNIKSDDKEIGEGECCAICIEPYKTSDVLRILPCTHEFHKNCIDPWLLEHRTCPMCKMDILKHYGFVFTGSQESILHMEMDIEVVAGLDSGDIANSPRRSGGISPLPQIRAVVDHQRSYGSSIDGDDQSRSSSPNELTPSLSSSNHRRNNHTTVTIPSVAKATPTTSTLPVATPTTTQQQQQSQTTTSVVNSTATTVLPVRQDLCVSCIAAAAAAASLVNQSSESGNTATAVTSANDCDKSEQQPHGGDESDDTNSSSDSSSQRVETSKLVQ